MASPEAKFAPVGALRGGLALMIIGALMVWGPMGDIPREVGFTVLVVGGLLVAVALGIRSMRG